MLDYASLSAVAVVVREGSFERAARTLNVTPSAISQRVKQLEERLGGVLIVRGQPCTATGMGRLICRHVEQVGMLEHELHGTLPRLAPVEATDQRVTIRVAVNADSLGTWFVGAMAAFLGADRALLDVAIDDQEHTQDWLRAGDVLAAVTADSHPVQGCESIPIGKLKYCAVASPEYVRRYFPEGVTAAALTAAPSLRFNRKDRLQAQWMRNICRRDVDAPSHWLPSTQAFTDASVAGIGWGMNPRAMVASHHSQWITGGTCAGTVAVGAALLAAHSLADAYVGAIDEGRDHRFTRGTEVTDTLAMANRTGSADLPLHNGFVPPWLVTRMAALGRVIVEAIVHHYGRDELLRRLAHPFWFQSFGAVMGMDWHSSGITTSVIGALKRGLSPIQRELGLYVCGGRGRHSRRTPDDLIQVGERTGLDAVPLVRASRLVAKVDSAAVQDGFDLYLHSFIVTDDGKWCVVQQGMSDARSEARRYHWLSEDLESFLDSPHSAIEGPNKGVIVNLADVRATRNRSAGMELVRGGPDLPISILRRLRDRAGSGGGNPGRGSVALSLFPEIEPQVREEPPLPHLHMPAHHDVRASDVVLRRLHGILAAAADRGPKDFTDLLLTPGVGARTIASLALVAEVVHGTPSRFSDPARFSMAHGGKDGHPFPVPLRVYDETIRVLKSAVNRAKLGNADRLHAIQRLDRESRVLERATSGPTFNEFVRDERAKSVNYDGRTV